MTDYKPGTVAEITLYDDMKYRALFDGEHWRFADRGAAWGSAVIHVRPLVVLDIEYSAGTYRELVEYLREGSWLFPAAQIEEQTKPPRLAEPGVWGVVNARFGGDDYLTRKWVRYGTGWRDAFGEHASWDDLIDPVLVREGV